MPGLRGKFGLFEIGFLLLILSGLVYFLSEKEWKWRTHSASEPQIISAAKLANEGPGNNWYVQIRDFQFGDPMVAYIQGALGSKAINSVSCRLIPVPLEPENANALIVTKLVKSEREAKEFLSQHSILGFAESASHGMVKITASKRKSDSEVLLGFVAPGVVLFLLGVACTAIGFIKRAHTAKHETTLESQ